MHVEEVPEFLNIAKELLGDARVWDMQKYIQHGSISCLEHSFVVSYYSFTLVRKLRMSCDERSLVRARCCMTIFYMTGMRQRIGTDCMAFATLFLRIAMHCAIFKSVNGSRKSSASICGR